MSGVDLQEQAVEQRCCASCGHALAGPFCARCGQNVLAGRHTLWRMFLFPLFKVLGLDEGLDSNFRLQKGLLYTAFRLTIAPGRMVREYLGGRTVPYTHPILYLIVSFASFALMNAWTQTIGGAGDHREFAVFGILMLAGVSRLTFWAARLNYTEHLIFVMYLFAHVTFFFTFTQVALHLTAATGADIVLAVAALALGVGYFSWAYSRLFDRRPVLGAGGGLLVVVGGILLWFYATGAILQVLRSQGVI
jgi:hypothetical protein